MKGTAVIVGLGLIGGSIGLAILQENPDAEVIGFDSKEKEIRLAKAMNAITYESTDLKQEIERADVVFLCTPVFQTEKLIEQIAEWTMKPGAIITDVGSTKKRIMHKAKRLTDKGFTFIGGHPMAGSHKSGVAASKVFLFENAFYLLTPGPNTTENQLGELKRWLAGTKAKFLLVDPDEHDEITGMVSHFPHIVASSLVHQVKKVHSTQPLISRLAAGGFRDLSRIASSDPVMWRDITLHNVDVIKKLLKGWQQEMDQVIKILDQKDEEGIFQYFNEAKQFRDNMPILQKGAIPSFYDLFVDIPDYPGIISEITGLLAKEKISIVNIRIMETREDIYGVLTISFQTDEDRQRGEACLRATTPYEVFMV
ncbi:prephenate dehydrogenase [Jeotgalibacillus proteolyticus]|uniref:Prephenate dehydrogenase n=1 Tax=Jeotgalibacillus proteolyticus TaxID=2082395 RepID=A0A2S5GE19_9BACL|nr:prephenate dehydrogenase [Jeotgalibacillus proteolyticus]PPA71260.1 prephenate dehydrogenase [Jeotgalibacillus proteolyticus]